MIFLTNKEVSGFLQVCGRSLGAADKNGAPIWAQRKSNVNGVMANFNHHWRSLQVIQTSYYRKIIFPHDGWMYNLQFLLASLKTKKRMGKKLARVYVIIHLWNCIRVCVCDWSWVYLHVKAARLCFLPLVPTNPYTLSFNCTITTWRTVAPTSIFSPRMHASLHFCFGSKRWESAWWLPHWLGGMWR